MRRVVTFEGPAGSQVLIDAAPSTHFAGLFEAWREALAGPLDPHDRQDRGPDDVRLRPPAGGFAARWFAVAPTPPGAAPDAVEAAAARTFEKLGALDCHLPGAIDPSLHRTDSIDIVCLLSGSASLVLETGEIALSPGCVVIQRGTAHAWRAQGGVALFFAVLIDRTPAS